jgi:hypothetical protein
MKTLKLDVIEIDLGTPEDVITVYIDVHDSSLSRKWLSALNELIAKDYHLEKNYCFFGFPDGPRSGDYLIAQINASIAAINSANLGYYIDDHFGMDSVLDSNLRLVKNRFNRLHVYFEDLQGVSGSMSPYYTAADARIRWHIRQLNLLCHEFESWALSWNKKHTAPEWQRCSQLMCWLSAPRFMLTEEDHNLFGIETVSRPLGGVFVGVNKAIGKNHYEVFSDEGRDSRIGELTTTALKLQTEAAGDFDIEWANNPGTFPWHIRKLKEFREWLIFNGFDPEDKSLTIGHPQVGQVDLKRSFGTEDYRVIWAALNTHLNVQAIRTSQASATYTYNWTDSDYAEQQIARIIQGTTHAVD